MTTITILRAGPLTTLQDEGRFGMLKHGISASGPMDRGAFLAAGAALKRAGTTAIEFTQGLIFETDGPLTVAWPRIRTLGPGDSLEIPPAAGNYGYLRFDREIDVPPLLGSRSTNLTVGLGGYKGRALKARDRIAFGAERRRHKRSGPHARQRADPLHLGHARRTVRAAPATGLRRSVVPHLDQARPHGGAP